MGGGVKYMELELLSSCMLTYRGEQKTRRAEHQAVNSLD